MNPNTTHPLVQAAMNILQQNVGQPIQNGIQDFTKGYTGQAGQGATSNNLAQSFGDFVANGAGGGEVTGLLGKGAGALSQNAHLMPLAFAALGNSDGEASKFGSALRSAGKAIYGAKGMVHPDDIHDLAPIVDRMLNTPHSDIDYHINQLPQDHALVQPVAEHYLPGVTKTLKNDPIEIARALVQRVAADRMK